MKPFPAPERERAAVVKTRAAAPELTTIPQETIDALLGRNAAAAAAAGDLLDNCIVSLARHSNLAPAPDATPDDITARDAGMQNVAAHTRAALKQVRPVNNIAEDYFRNNLLPKVIALPPDKVGPALGWAAIAAVNAGREAGETFNGDIL